MTGISSEPMTRINSPLTRTRIGCRCDPSSCEHVARGRQGLHEAPADAGRRDAPGEERRRQRRPSRRYPRGRIGSESANSPGSIRLPRRVWTSSASLSTPSFVKTRARCFATVWKVIPNLAAIRFGVAPL